ncbi:glycoside hydrolase family 16 protein [Mucilaginibacter sp.]
MKISISFPSLLVGMFIILLGSCKKSKGPNATPIDPTLNPVVAHVINDYSLFNDTTLTNKGWTKTFEDNFDGDLSKWKVWTGGGFQRELQCYEPSNLQIANGYLQISAKKQTITGPTGIADSTLKSFDFTSGGIQSISTICANTSTPKVMIVARIKIAKGYGMASNFWSYGLYWPTNGEIDFLESRGDVTTEYHTQYFYGPTVGQNIVTNGIIFNPTDGDLGASYHVYEMEWTQNSLSSYLDGKLVETKTGGHIADLFGKPENITLNLAVGGLLYNTLDVTQIQLGTIDVDYVKVFTSN